MTTTYADLCELVDPIQAGYFDDYFVTEAAADAQLLEAVRLSMAYERTHPDIKSEQVAIDDVLTATAQKYYLTEKLFARLLDACERNLTKV